MKINDINSPRLGKYKPGRIPVATLKDGETLYADPPEVQGTIHLDLDAGCGHGAVPKFLWRLLKHLSLIDSSSGHEFANPVITGEMNFYGDGWHQAILTEQCSVCAGTRKQIWKTAVWYEGM